MYGTQKVFEANLAGPVPLWACLKKTNSDRNRAASRAEARRNKKQQNDDWIMN